MTKNKLLQKTKVGLAMIKKIWEKIKSLLAFRWSMYVVSTIIVLLGFIITFQFVEPGPPSTITIATGSQSGAYYRYALEYKKILARDGVTVNIRETNGSVENLALLDDPDSGVDLAFAQGGINSKSNALVSLGSMYYEPLWVFYRSNLVVNQLSDLKGKKVVVGTEGSGTQALAMEVLAQNGITNDNTKILHNKANEAHQGLLTDNIDAMFLVASHNAPIVQQLLISRKIAIMNFSRAMAYSRKFSYLSLIMLPEGALNLGLNLPVKNIQLLATTANLVSSEDLHPAIVSLVLQAATEIHSQHGLFERYGQFPTSKYSSLPLHTEAIRYYKYGPTLLQRYLPFWVANWIDRLKIMLLPFIVLMIPLFKIMPPFLRWLIRKRIYKWYASLRLADPDMEFIPLDQVDKCLSQLTEIEEELKHVSVPLAYTDEFYNLRLHIEMVRKKLLELKSNEGI